MDNKELELKIKEILTNENFFDMMIAISIFEKEYKGSEFYKITKMPLTQVVKEYKVWSVTDPREIQSAVQKIINGLDITNLQNLIEKMSSVFAEENTEIMQEIKKLNLENFWK